MAIEARKSPKYAGQITDDYVNDISHASPLHDIGKVRFPTPFSSSWAR
jgi:response regulator RpfG family c-di-GMP phosphodiesterase